MYWTITNTELSAEGNGQCQLTATVNNVIAKSIIFETLIGPALDGSGEVPEPWEDWREDFIEYADEAKTAAEEASVASTQAVNAATSAAQSSDDAANSATAAETAQVNAEDAADRAEEAAGSIGDLAEDAEAWAVGQRGGVDVPDTDPAYENNAKYYAEQAELSEHNASVSAGLAETSADVASTQAGNAATAANTASGKADEAAQSAGAAQASAGSAASSASDAADSARAASDIADEIKELTAEAETLPAGSSATADYDAETGVLSIGVPVGDNGDPGVSPTVTVTDITGGHRITITDATGPHSFDVMNGPDGIGIPTGGTTGQVLSKASGTDYDTEWTTPSGGDVTDVQVNGTSVVSGGVANVPVAGDSVYGAVKTSQTYGTGMYDGKLQIQSAPASHYKGGDGSWRPVVPAQQHQAVFYGLAKAAGADMKNIVSTTVGVYPEAQKSAISQMLNSPVTITGSTPAITALPGVRYVCGECATLDITLPASGCVDVVFESGSTPTVLTITPPTGVTVKWANGFDPTALEANTTYEINIRDGLGVGAAWT